MTYLKKIHSFSSPQQKPGFTLVELLLYIGVSGLILLAVASLALLIVETRKKNQTIAEVEQQGLQVASLLSQTVRNATGFNTPTLGQSSTTLSVTTASSNTNPTIFDLSAGALRIKEGASTAINLTASFITASAFNVANVSRSATTGSVRISFVLSHTNPGSQNEYTYSKTFYVSASIR